MGIIFAGTHTPQLIVWLAGSLKGGDQIEEVELAQQKEINKGQKKIQKQNTTKAKDGFWGGRTVPSAWKPGEAEHAEKESKMNCYHQVGEMMASFEWKPLTMG